MNQVGIDISNEVFDATMQHSSGVVRKQFSNTKTGHRQFIRWALYQASSARICLIAQHGPGHPNVAAVALANKTARMAWAMLRNETDYDPDFAIS